jgi:hypothetical protein
LQPRKTTFYERSIIFNNEDWASAQLDAREQIMRLQFMIRWQSLFDLPAEIISELETYQGPRKKGLVSPSS